MVFKFMVSKTQFEIIMSQLEQIIAQTLQENSSRISIYLKSQSQIFKATACVLRVSCIINIWVLQGVTMRRKFKLRQHTRASTKPSASSDRLSEIEFDVRPSQLCVTFHDILSKVGPLFYSNND